MNYVAKITTNSGSLLFEGNYDKCMALVHSVEGFDKDYVRVEIWEDESGKTVYVKKNPYWS